MPRPHLACIRPIALAATLVAVLVAVACSSGTAAPTATSGSAGVSATATAPATPGTPATSATATPRADANRDGDGEWAVPVHPASTRTGIAVVDEVLDAVIAGEGPALAALTDFQERPCTTDREGIGYLDCPEGVADETPLPVIQLAFCEGTYVMPEHIDGPTEALFRHGLDSAVDPLRLYAIVRVDDDPTLFDAEYRLLLAFPNGVGRQVWVSERGVTMLWWGCGDVPVAQMTVISSAEPEPAFLLPPATS